MIQESEFRPAWWLPDANLQTLFPHFFDPKPLPNLHRKRLELDDGDFLDLHFTTHQDGPLLLLLHGLEGSLKSHYVKSLLNALPASGLQCVLLNFRNCSGEPNRLPRSYHSGETGDLQSVLTYLQKRYPERDIYALGISLGGNVLLKWLGENPQQQQVQRAMAVSVPFQLNLAADRMQKGFSRVYQWHLIHKLQSSLRKKALTMSFPLDLSRLNTYNTFYKFDDSITAPLHSFSGVDDYYYQSSCSRYLHKIDTPTLILHARNDPFLTTKAIPNSEELGASVTLEIADSGGHVGFVYGKVPWKPRYWIHKRALDFFLH